MKLADFSYNLPPELIAKYPANDRTASRLLVAENSNKLEHKSFKDIADLFNPDDILVLNNTKVIPARFYGQKTTGAKVEFLLERILENNQALCYIKANKSPKPGTVINIDIYSITVLEKRDNLYLIELNVNNSDKSLDWHGVLDKIGSLPLPPYINRQLNKSDSERYQTVFAEKTGAVAAPTAGLHFDEYLLAKLESKGIKIRYVTLHVGAGTFAPVRVENITEHKMHSERYSISLDLIEEIKEVKKDNNKSNKIIACGTTSLRCLESVFRDLDVSEESVIPAIEPGAHITGETDIFIYPGFEFKAVDSLITNFHLPESTLMMLVSAFAGYSEIKHIYQQAIENNYRFFSYGDAMWLNKKI